MADAAKDLASGTVGGAAQLIVGHPFDTIKVKLQSQPAPSPGQPPRYTGAIDAVKQTVASEGPKGLYKGMGAPLATVAAFNAVLFTVRGQMEGLLRSEPGVPLTISQQFVCGAGAGFAVSFLACPTELIKCRLQAQGAGGGASTTGSVVAAVKYGGPMDVARHVLRSEGGARGLFKGLFPTFAREVPGNATMFAAYEAFKRFLAGGSDTSSLGQGSLIMAGGVAGASFWGFVYPTDVVKSVLQVDDYKNPKYKGSMDAFRKILKAEGVKGLYKGFGPAMARSVPANAACFLAYEMTSLMETMEQQRHSLSSLPMLSRLEHLDFVIKNLERQQNLSKWKDENTSTTRGLIDRGTAVREAYFKGSLLDRIAALETRLFQICLELESGSASSTSTGGSGETSNQRIKRDLTKTLPIFTSNVNPFHIPLQPPHDTHETEEKIEEEEEEEEEINTEKPLLEKKNKKKVANETCKPNKKTKSPKKWCRFNLL
ncbi:hypothetical protein IGI04_007689, partial [Brassica rapa subsp. trilocularis]